MKTTSLADWLAQPSTDQLIDVRERDEFAQGHVPGAKNLPLSDIDQWKDQLDPDQGYALMCQMGGRALRASLPLQQAGIAQLTLITDGFASYDGPVARTGEP